MFSFDKEVHSTLNKKFPNGEVNLQKLDNGNFFGKFDKLSTRTILHKNFAKKLNIM